MPQEKKATIKKEHPYLVKLSKPYQVSGEDFTQLDLSGLEDLRSEDLFEANRQFATESYITPKPECDPMFCCLLAAMASGKPPELFEKLNIKDTLKVRNCVQDFFQSEG